MNFKHFFRAQFSKLRNGINGVGRVPVRYYIYVAKISYQADNWFGNCQGGQNCTDTHRHRGLFYVLFSCKNAETRLKRKQREQTLKIYVRYYKNCPLTHIFPLLIQCLLLLLVSFYHFCYYTPTFPFIPNLYRTSYTNS